MLANKMKFFFYYNHVKSALAENNNVKIIRNEIRTQNFIDFSVFSAASEHNIRSTKIM